MLFGLKTRQKYLTIPVFDYSSGGNLSRKILTECCKTGNPVLTRPFDAILHITHPHACASSFQLLGFSFSATNGFDKEASICATQLCILHSAASILF